MNPRAILLTLAGVFVIVGLALGSRSIEAGPNPFEQSDCGSVFKPDSSKTSISDSISGDDSQGDCESARSDAKPLTFGALGAGVLALIGALVAPAKTPERVD